MAGPLAAIERFFERIFERPPARLFATQLEREHLQRQLLRTMESERVVHGRRTFVPTAYRIRLNPADLLQLQEHATLTAELAEGLRAHARSRGYVLTNRPRITLERFEQIEPGEVSVISDEVVGPAPTTNGRRKPVAQPGASASAGSVASPNGSSPPIDAGHTSTFEAARPTAPRATIAVQVPGHAPWRVGISSGRLRVGRAKDNDLVLPDDRVSRHHGQISVRFGTLVYADLGSTNGSYANGERVTEIALGPTDVLQLGGSSLTVEPGQ